MLQDNSHELENTKQDSLLVEEDNSAFFHQFCGLKQSECQRKLLLSNATGRFDEIVLFWVLSGVYNKLTSLGARPSKNRKGGSGTSAGVEVYTAEC